MGAHTSPSPCHALVVIITLLIIWSTSEALASCWQKGELLFRHGSPNFRVAMFADLHYGENAWTDWGPLQDVNSDQVISYVLDTESPDFVVYLGDVITANNLPTPNASLYWDKAISPTRRRGIPWATVFGNHDDASFEWPTDWFSSTGIPTLCSNHRQNSGHGSSCKIGGVHRTELVEKEIKSNHKKSCTQIGSSELWPSVSNYFLQLKSSQNMNKTVATFYFLDSGGGSYPEMISTAQASWFLNKSQELNPSSNIPEIIFWHIPSKAYKEVAPKIDTIPKPCVGSINMEKVAAQEAEWGIMDIITKKPSVKAIFVGHNHGLDWCCPYKKLWLCYARHTGYGGYGNWSRGARILEITQQPFFIKSWIRMEDGQKHSEIILAT